MNPYTAPVDSLVEEKDEGFQIVRHSLPRRMLGVFGSIGLPLLPLLPSLGFHLTWSWENWGIFLPLLAWFVFSAVHEWWKSDTLEKRLWTHPITLGGKALYGGIGTIKPPRGREAGDYIFVTADSLVFGIESPDEETTQWMALSLGSIRSVSRIRRLPRRTLRLEADSGAFILDSPHPRLWLRLIQERIEESPLIPPWSESRKPVEWGQ